MVHICSDEIGYAAMAIAAVGSFIKPVRDCVKCYAVYYYNKARGK